MPPTATDLIVFDGACVFCSDLARSTARADRAGRFRFVTAQSPTGQALHRRHGLDPVAMDTNVVIVDGRAHVRMAAFAAAMRGPDGEARVEPEPRVDRAATQAEPGATDGSEQAHGCDRAGRERELAPRAIAVRELPSGWRRRGRERRATSVTASRDRLARVVMAGSPG